MSELTPESRRALRAQAHHLHPVVSIGREGLTSSVLHAIDQALKAHELVKVRVFNDNRDERDDWLRAICAAVNCAPVQHLGKLLILWRPKPADETASAPLVKKPANKRGAAPRARKSVAANAEPITPRNVHREAKKEGRRVPSARATTLHPAASSIGGRRTRGGPAGVPRAPNPRRRRMSSR